ncbi:MAG: hypothetical protein KDB72_19930 [Mycobacterium sp.]|nr:hypothetical protein [Mycobacterium sp.]
MGVLRFIWQRVLAFDRVGSRIPRLVQIWLVELFFACRWCSSSALVAGFFFVRCHEARRERWLPATGTVIEQVTDDQRTCHGLGPHAFGEPPTAAE